jgi:ribonuclease Z
MFQPELKSRPKEDICILLQLDNHAPNYICECGDASDLSVKDAQNADAVFLSHTHIDHFISFDTLLRHQIGGGKRIVVCGPKHITAQVRAKIKGYSWNLIEEGAIVYEVRDC